MALKKLKNNQKLSKNNNQLIYIEHLKSFL